MAVTSRIRQSRRTLSGASWDKAVTSRRNAAPHAISVQQAYRMLVPALGYRTWRSSGVGR
eukprot:2444681-Rhodomonas_salina.2